MSLANAIRLQLEAGSRAAATLLECFGDALSLQSGRHPGPRRFSFHASLARHIGATSRVCPQRLPHILSMQNTGRALRERLALRHGGGGRPLRFARVASPWTPRGWAADSWSCSSWDWKATEWSWDKGSDWKSSGRAERGWQKAAESATEAKVPASARGTWGEADCVVKGPHFPEAPHGLSFEALEDRRCLLVEAMWPSRGGGMCVCV